MSIEMLFGSMALLMVLLLIFEATAYWHARNVFDEAATEGVRVAAAYSSSCEAGIAAAESIIERMASGWSSSVVIECAEASAGVSTVSVTVSGRTPGVVAGGLGFAARVTETAPAER
ncbi:MAG: TadE/TadG family type IV pilus assembly protein [Ilumatobacteraceae bacterium]